MKLHDLVGLTRIKQLAAIEIISCRKRAAVFSHTILYGPGGTGKTAIARAIGDELGYHFVEIEAATLRSREDIIDCLARHSAEAMRCRKTLLFFVDEVHRLSVKLQEVFYYPMREFRITTARGDIDFLPFCLFAATTRLDLLDYNSFVKRFSNEWKVERYSSLHIRDMVLSIFSGFRPVIKINEMLALKIAKRSLGIPRIAHTLCEKVRDVALATGNPEVNDNILDRTFDLLGVDSIGLERIHRSYLRVLSGSGKARGVSGLAAQLSQPEDVLRGVVEPILAELGFVEFTSKGRVITKDGKEYLTVSG